MILPWTFLEQKGKWWWTQRRLEVWGRNGRVWRSEGFLFPCGSIPPILPPQWPRNLLTSSHPVEMWLLSEVHRHSRHWWICGLSSKWFWSSTDTQTWWVISPSLCYTLDWEYSFLVYCCFYCSNRSSLTDRQNSLRAELLHSCFQNVFNVSEQHPREARFLLRSPVWFRPERFRLES